MKCPIIAACFILLIGACLCEDVTPEKLKEQVEQRGANWELAADTLRALSRHPEPWRGYAARRLTALADAGLIPKADPDLIQAWQKIYTEHFKASRWSDANRVLGIIARLDRRKTMYRLQRAELLAKARRMDLAEAEFLTLSKSLPISHSNREISPRLSRLHSAVRPALSARTNATIDFDDPEQERRRFWLSSIDKLNPKDFAPLHAVMQVALDENSRVRSSRDGLSRSFWLLLDQRLQKLGPDKKAALRKIQDSKFPQSEQHTSALNHWRKYPFASEALKELFTYASEQLKKGAHDCAARSFKEIISHSSDQQLFAKAKQGLTQCRQSPVPIAQSVPEISIPSLPPHHPRLIRSDHPLITIQTNGDHILATAPTWLACYSTKDTKNPIWLKTSDTLQIHGGQSIGTFVPDSNHPSISCGRVFSRWGFSDIAGDNRHDWFPGKSSLPASRYRVCRTDFAAFDLMSGDMLWSTAGAHYWKHLLPAGDPLARNGRVYLPAADATPGRFIENKTEFLMLCLDAKTGNFIWKQRVGEITFRSYINRRQVLLGFHTALAFEQARIYCSTGGGLVASLDARDGLLEWSRAYHGYNPLPSTIEPFLNKENPSPYLSGDSILFSPIDNPGSFALEKHTGRLLWDDPFQLPTSRAKTKRVSPHSHTPKLPHTNTPPPPTRRLKIGTLTITAPPASDFISHTIQSDRIYTCSLRSPAPSMDSPVTAAHYRIDSYDASKGTRLASRDLFHIYPSTVHSKEHLARDITWSSNRLTIKNDEDIHRIPLAIPTPTNAPDYQIPVYRTSSPILIDGVTNDYSSTPISSTGPAPRAALHLSRNSKILFLAVSYPNPQFSPFIGRGRFGGDGDWLEVSLRTNRKPDDTLRRQAFEWDIGIDTLGRTIHHRTIPDNLISVARYDINTQTSIYEMAIPLDSICKRPAPNDTRIQLSLTLYDNSQQTTAKDFTPTQWRAVQLRLIDFTRDEEQAALTIASNIPHLNESHWILKQLIHQHVHEWPAGKDFITHSLRTKSPALFNARILRLLDERLRNVTGQDPTRIISTFGKNPTQLPSAGKIDTAKSVSLLKQSIPRLRRTEAAIRFFTALVELAKPAPKEEIDLLAWFLKKVPGQSHDPVYLEAIWELAIQSAPDQAAEIAEKIISECNIPAAIAQSFRRKRSHTAHGWLKQWHIVGPFPANEVSDMEFETVLPPAQKKITLREAYRVQGNILRWKTHFTDSEHIDLTKELGQQYPGAKAYAVTYIETPKAGWASLELAFYTQCRAWLNRRLVYRSNDPPDKAWIEAGWVNRQAPFVRRAPVWLPKGWSILLVECANGRKGWQFKAELAESTGNGTLAGLRTMRPGGPQKIAVVAGPSPVPKSFGKGLRAEIYDNVDFLGPRMVRKDPHICIDWKVESPDSRIQWETWSVRWTGKITPKYSEPYTFIIRCNDGVRFWIDGRLLINNWTYHSHKADYATIDLQAGKQHDFQIEFYEWTDWSNLWLWWRSASQKEEIVPPEAFTSSWYRVKTYGPAIQTEPPKPTGPPRFTGVRIQPREIWMPPGWKYTFKSIPLDQYGKTLDTTKSFDQYGKPFDTSVKWSVVPGGRINLLMMYGGGYWLEHRLKKATGKINQTGEFTSDGSFGCVTIVAQSTKNPAIRTIATIAIENYMSIQPDTVRPLCIGGDLAGRSFDGDIDRARIYKIALTEQQIVDHFKGKKLTDKGVVCDWTFDELVNGVYPNQAARGLDGKPVGRVKLVKENDLAYLRFEGGRIEVAQDKRLNITKSCTLEAWIRPRVQTSQGVVFDKHLGGTVRGYRLDLGGGVKAQGMFGHGWLEAGHRWATDFWSHLVAVYDVNGVRKIYVDGKLIRERKKGVQIIIH